MKPEVRIDYLVYQKVMHWVKNTNYEVSGLGKVVVKDNVLRVVDAILLPQKNTHTSSDIEPEDICKAMYLLKDTPGDLRWWWHSHVNMGVFWSGTDHSTMKDLAKQGWFLNTVFNKKSETRTAIQMGVPFELCLDELPISIEHSIPEGLVAEWDRAVKENVTNVPFARAGRVSTFGGKTRVWDTTTSTTPRLTKRERKELKKQQRILDANSLMDDDVLPCPLCMFQHACDCDPTARYLAEELERQGMCFVCERLDSACNCTHEELQQYLFEAGVKVRNSILPSPAASQAARAIIGAAMGPPASNNGSTGGVY